MKKQIPLSILYQISLYIFFALLALIVLVYGNPGLELPRRDSGFYAYIGSQILDGRLPYLDVWESKPPAIFYLNAFALMIGGGLRWGIWLVEFIFLLCAISASFHLLRRLWGVAPAFGGLLTWLWGLHYSLQGGNLTEEYPLVFHFTAMILFLDLIRKPAHRLLNFTLGLLFSISFLFRPNNALVEVVLIITWAALFLLKYDFRGFIQSFIWVFWGSFLPLMAISLYFASHGLFQQMFESAILYNLSYSATSLGNTSPLITGFQVLKLSAWIALPGYFLLWRTLRTFTQDEKFPLYIALLVGFPFAVYLSDPARRTYAHYYMNWLPFIAIFGGFFFYMILNQFRRRWRIFQPLEFHLPLAALLAGMLVFWGSGRASAYIRSFDLLLAGEQKELRSAISIYVENHTNPGEYVLFWAIEPGENFMSNRPAPHSTLFYPMLVDSDISTKLNDDFLSDIYRNNPVLIIDLETLDRQSLDPQIRARQESTGISWPYFPDNLAEFYAFVEKNYYLDAVINGKSVYRLRGTSRP